MYSMSLEEKIFDKIFSSGEEGVKKIALKKEYPGTDFDKKIEECEVGSERKKYRSERKYPKQALKRFKDFIKRKEKYEKDMEIFEASINFVKKLSK